VNARSGPRLMGGGHGKYRRKRTSTCGGGRSYYPPAENRASWAASGRIRPLAVHQKIPARAVSDPVVLTRVGAVTRPVRQPIAGENDAAPARASAKTVGLPGGACRADLDGACRCDTRSLDGRRRYHQKSASRSQAIPQIGPLSTAEIGMHLDERGSPFHRCQRLVCAAGEEPGLEAAASRALRFVIQANGCTHLVRCSTALSSCAPGRCDECATDRAIWMECASIQCVNAVRECGAKNAELRRWQGFQPCYQLLDYHHVLMQRARPVLRVLQVLCL
jgi:hypothetical protein